MRWAFAAVHEKHSWRRASHESQEAAISGKDGAMNLLRGTRRVGKKAGPEEYGAVFAVFVWDKDAPESAAATALRLAPGRSLEIEQVSVPIWQLLAFKKGSGPSREQIEEWFSGTAPVPGPWHPDDVPEHRTYVEGVAKLVEVNAFERNPAARQACIDHYAPICRVCGLDFEDRYGPLGRGFIHVHHEVPLAAIGHGYEVDPIKDLKPVCPNCHAMLHRQEPPLSIYALRKLLRP